MRNTFYGILTVGLLLFLSSNIYANSTPDCKPSVHIQPVKGNYIPLLNGDIEKLEKFLLELAEQNPNYCNVSLRLDFKKGLETKQTITHGKPKYNEKLYLEVQYFLPAYEAVIKNSAGDILHKVGLGKELKSIEYANSKLDSHDALYAEWRRMRSANFSKIEKDANNFQALIDFLKVENGMAAPQKTSLAIKEKKDVLASKGSASTVEEKEKITRKNKKKKAKKASKKKSKSKAKKEKAKEVVKADTKTVQKSSQSKVEKKTQATNKESKEIVKNKTQSTQKNNPSKVENAAKAKNKVEEKSSKEMAKTESKPVKKIVEKPKSKSATTELKNKVDKSLTKETASSDLEKYSPPPTSTEVTEVTKVDEAQTEESSESREIISDDEMFEDVGVVEPLARMVRFEFPFGKNYKVVNDSYFSIKINTGRKGGKVFAKNSIKPKQEKNVKNKFKIGDWYSIEYPEKLHKKDIEDYKKSMESILSELKLSAFEDDFFKMADQLIPNLDIITNENPLADKTQEDKVEVRFQRFIKEKGIELFNEGQQEVAVTELKKLLTLNVLSHRLHQYYKYTVGSSAAHRPVDKLPRFRKN